MRWIALLYAVSTFISSATGQLPGEEWVTRRGDEVPRLNLSAAVTARNGRIIAVGPWGNLMISDNNGGSWRFDAIKIGSDRVSGLFTALYQVPGENGRLIAIMKRLEKYQDEPPLYGVRTYFVTSGDNGITWSLSPFPVPFATFEGNGGKFYGVDIKNLQMGPGGELLAYGTTSVTRRPGTSLWSIGGAIFRQSGGTWVQAFFGNGPVGKIANAGGRAVAAVYNGVLDSADGAGWNGYSFWESNFTLDGTPMDFETLDRLRILDIEVLNGTYIAQGATFLPFNNMPGIDSNIADRAFKFSSPTPFSGSRNWSAFSQPEYYGPLTSAGGQIISAGLRGVYSTSSGGPGFTLRDETVRTTGNTLAVSGGSTVVAVGNSESAWRSIDGGDSWSKVWDKDPGPDLKLIASFDGRVYARANNRELWISSDGGGTWERTGGDFHGYKTIVPVGDDRLISPRFAPQIEVSDDGGVTWTTKQVVERGGEIDTIFRSSTGRLIAPARGVDVSRRGKFYVSDDEGDTWQEKNAGLQFSEDPAGITQAKNGRLIVPSSTFFPFNPTLNFSDDDGETWRSSNVLRRLEGLRCIANQPEEKVINIKKILTSSSGRIFILGDEEIISSDDAGESWTVRINLPLDNPSEESISWSIEDIIQAGTRWIAICSAYDRRVGASFTFRFTLTSDDDGATWGRQEFETNETSTYLDSITLAGDGRVLIAGGNGAIFTSDFAAPLSAAAPEQSIREGNTGTITIPRPDVDGIVEARYGTISRTAIAETDFISAGGLLSWASDDLEDKSVSITTIDNSRRDQVRDFVLQLTFETADGLLGTIESTVAIIEDDILGGGVSLGGMSDVVTSEAGGSVTVPIALDSAIREDVTITITGLDTGEGQLSQNTFTFTPENRNVFQNLIITGVDDLYPDGDSTYQLRLLDTSNFTSSSELNPLVINVTNTSDEPYIPGGELFERLGDAYTAWVAANEIPIEQSGPFMDPNNDDIQNLSAYAFSIAPLGGSTGSPLEITSDRTVTFRVSDSAENLTFTSQINPGLEFLDWVTGPDPVAGGSSGGFTNYTFTIPADSDARFARILVGIEN